MDIIIPGITATIDLDGITAHIDSKFEMLQVDIDARLATMEKAILEAIAAGESDDGEDDGDAEEFFPEDASDAKFPSPENSAMDADDGQIGGKPYLKDGEGTTHQLRITAGVVQYFRGSVPLVPTAGWVPDQLLVRQGKVFSHFTNTRDGNSIWQLAGRNTVLPPAWTGGGGTDTPKLPALPTPSAIAPGSTGVVVNCGIGQVLATIAAGVAAAKAGDTLKIAPGDYHETFPAITMPIVIDGSGATISAKGLTAKLARGKGLFVLAADCIIRDLTITDVAADQTIGQLTSAIRPDEGCGYLTIEGVTVRDCQCAVGAGGFLVVIKMTDCDISNNGLKVNTGSRTHNLYVGLACRRLTLINVISDGCWDAHAIKFRGPELIVVGGSYSATNGSCFDLSNGSTVQAKIEGAKLTKPAGSPDHKIIHYAPEGTENGLAGVLIKGGSIDAKCDNPTLSGAGGTITLEGVALTGNKITAAGGVTVVGL